MHPAVKIVSLVILSMFSTQGGWFTLLLTGALLLPFYILRPLFLYTALRMLLRLKWFFFSILLIYLVLTPELPIEHQSIYFNNLSALNTFLNQALPGLFRIMVLVLIIFAVNLFLRTTSKESILAALLWLFTPLKILTINIERISLRAMLTLDYIEKLTAHLDDYKQKNSIKKDKDIANREILNWSSLNGFKQSFKQIISQKKDVFFHLIAHSGIILREILDEAKNTSGKIVTIDCLESPNTMQLMIPVSLGVLYILSL